MATTYGEVEFFNYITQKEDIIEDVEFQVEGYVTPYTPAKFGNSYDSSYPAEGGELEEYTITLDGREITDAEFLALGGDFDKLTEALSEEQLACEEDCAVDAAADAADC
jgi:hypothetical protein